MHARRRICYVAEADAARGAFRAARSDALCGRDGAGLSARFLRADRRGWDAEDTTGKGAWGRLPMEAVEVEQIVGLFDTERGSGTLWTAAEFNAFAPRALTEAEIRSVRAVRGSLFEEWFALEPGQKIELQFS